LNPNPTIAITTDLKDLRAKQGLTQEDLAKAAADFARQTLSRRKEQIAVQAVSQQDVDAASQALASAEADVRFCEAQLSKTEIRSPLDGRVGISNVAFGQYLTAGQAVATVARTSPLKVDFQVPGAGDDPKFFGFARFFV